MSVERRVADVTFVDHPDAVSRTFVRGDCLNTVRLPLSAGDLWNA